MKSILCRQDSKLLRNEYESDNKWGIPCLSKEEIDLVNIRFMGYDKIGKVNSGNEDKTIHFILDDYKFNAIYSKPEMSLKKLARFNALLTPDFSLYVNMPLAVQIENVFKNRWCGAFWQDYGFTVIPTVGWSNESSYEFCFLGIDTNATIAISTVGSRRDLKDFMKGYDAMMEQLNPKTILCYGKPFKEMYGNVLYIPYLESTGRIA